MNRVVYSAILTSRYRQNYGYHDPRSYYDTETNIANPKWNPRIVITTIPFDVEDSTIINMYKELHYFVHGYDDPSSPKTGFKMVPKDSHPNIEEAEVPCVAYQSLFHLYEQLMMCRIETRSFSKCSEIESVEKDYDNWLQDFINTNPVVQQKKKDKERKRQMISSRSILLSTRRKELGVDIRQMLNKKVVV